MGGISACSMDKLLRGDSESLVLESYYNIISMKWEFIWCICFLLCLSNFRNPRSQWKNKWCRFFPCQTFSFWNCINVAVEKNSQRILLIFMFMTKNEGRSHAADDVRWIEIFVYVCGESLSFCCPIAKIALAFYMVSVCSTHRWPFRAWKSLRKLISFFEEHICIHLFLETLHLIAEWAT